MKEYKIEIGNSSTGQIGAVSYVPAKNKREALALFKKRVGYDNNDIRRSEDTIHVYFNPDKITLDNVSVVT